MDTKFNELKNKYDTSNTGYIIMGSSGIGKSHFSNTYYRHNKKITISSDRLIKYISGKKFSIENWLKIYNSKIKTYSNILQIAKQHGFKILCSPAFYNLIPDAIVILPWKTHLQYLKKKNNINLNIIKISLVRLKQLSKDHNIKIFTSIQDAVNYCENKSKNTISNNEFILLVIMILLIIKLYKN